MTELENFNENRLTEDCDINVDRNDEESLKSEENPDNKGPDSINLTEPNLTQMANDDLIYDGPHQFDEKLALPHGIGDIRLELETRNVLEELQNICLEFNNKNDIEETKKKFRQFEEVTNQRRHEDSINEFVSTYGIYDRQVASQSQTQLQSVGCKDYTTRMAELQKKEDNVSKKMNQLKMSSNISVSPDDATSSKTKEVDDDLVGLAKTTAALKMENEELRQKYKAAQEQISALVKQENNQKHMISTLECKIHKQLEELKCRDNRIQMQKEELLRQEEFIKTMDEEKKKYLAHISELEKKVEDYQLDFDKNSKEKLVQIEILQKKLEEYEIHTNQLKAKLAQLQSLLDNQLSKETINLANCEEALNMVERAEHERQAAILERDAAILERDKAMKKESEAKVEYHSLANTIGEVMEDAANKVDNDIATLHQEFNEKTQSLHATIDGLRNETQDQKEYINLLQKRSEQDAKKKKDYLAEISRLKIELASTQKVMGDLEIKLQCSVDQLNKDRRALEQAEVLEEQIRIYIFKLKTQKIQYNIIIEDLSKKFNTIMLAMASENSRLKKKICDLENENLTDDNNDC